MRQLRVMRTQDARGVTPKIGIVSCFRHPLHGFWIIFLCSQGSASLYPGLYSVILFEDSVPPVDLSVSLGQKGLEGAMLGIWGNL